MLGGVALQFLVAMAGALLLQNLVGGRWLRAIFVLPWATPLVVGALAWKLIWMWSRPAFLKSLIFCSVRPMPEVIRLV